MIRLINGTEFWFRSIGYEAELLRGFEFDCIGVDECGYITNELAIMTLKGRLLGVNPLTGLPRLGLLWQYTSPHGKTGWTYERWKLGDPRFPGARPDRYLSLRVKTIDNPLLDKTALEELMANYTDRQIQQELEGEFLDDTSAEFSIDQIMSCCDTQRPEVRELARQIGDWQDRQGKRRKSSLREELGLSSDLNFYELEPQAGRQYMASWDLGKKATKAGRNATVGMVWDVTELPWRLVAYRYEEGSGYLPAMSWIESWHQKYSSRGTQCQTILDATGKGDVLNELIEAEQRFAVDGMVYNSVLKPNLITAGKLAIERGLVAFPFLKRFVDQLSIYTQNDKDLPQDTVMAFCQFAYRARDYAGLGGSTRRSSDLILPAVYRRGVAPQVHTERLRARRQQSMQVRSRRLR
jgi:hypothetical protein